MLRFLTVTALIFSTVCYGLPEDQPVIDIESQNLIDQGIANGLTEVNETQDKDKPRYRDNSGMAYLAPPGGWKPNPANYKKIPSSIPPYFYRTVRDCKTKKIKDEQLIFTYNGYENYIGENRYQAQCIGDGTFDTYYVESIERQTNN